MSDLLIIFPLVVVVFALGFLFGMGAQVWSEIRWIKSSPDGAEKPRINTNGQ